MEYRRRIADQWLQEKLEAMGAVLIEGPKACGKTTTAEQQAKSVIYMDNPAMQQQYRQMAQTNISFLLKGKTPRLIDEWQEIPQFWDAIRFEVDHRNEDGQFMLIPGQQCLPRLRKSIIRGPEDMACLQCDL